MSAGVRLLAATPFEHAVVVSLRSEGLTALRVLPADGGAPHDIVFPEPISTVGLDHNLEYATDTIRVRYISLVTPENGSGALVPAPPERCTAAARRA